MRRRTLTFVALAGGLLAPPPALAAAECVLTAGAMSFGQFALHAGSPDQDSVANIDFSCIDDGLPPAVTEVSYTIRLGTGQGLTYLPRAMPGPGADLAYNLYVDMGRSIVWGDGSGGTQTVAGTVPVGGGANHPAFGRVPGGQSAVEPGLYTDSVTVTVEF